MASRTGSGPSYTKLQAYSNNSAPSSSTAVPSGPSSVLLWKQLVMRSRTLWLALVTVATMLLIIASSWPSIDERSTSVPLPSIAVVHPPLQLVQQLEDCAQLCSGRPLVASSDGDGGDQSFSALSDEQVELRTLAAFGTELDYIRSYPQDWPFLMRQTDQFALQSIISLRLEALAQANPSTVEQADFIFLALDTRTVARCLASCPHRDEFPTSFDRNAVKSDLRSWLLNTVGANRGRRSYPSLVLSLALIDHDYESNILDKRVQESIKDEVVVLGIEREPWDTEDKLAAFEQCPYPSTMHLPLQAADEGPSPLADWQLKRRQDRNYLVSFAGKREPNSANSGRGPHNGFALRQYLTDKLLDYNLTDPSLLSLHFFTPRSSRAELASVHIAMSQSTFCLQPPGDSPTRKGFWDSILTGCIPVIFRPGTYRRVWRGQFGGEVDVEDLAVVLDEQELLAGAGDDVVKRLQAVSEEEIERKREGIARWAEMAQYGVPASAEELRRLGGDWTGDAVGMMLRQLVSIRDK